jgi:two-component system, OmpR family, phosphate regulon response regulator OmpR
VTERVLLIDDDTRLAVMLGEYLTARGLWVEHQATATLGLAAARGGAFDVVLLDVMLPDGDGFALCRQLRSFSSVPIVMLTARGDDEDRIVGLELGADDYLPKPFNPRELLARIRAVLRRLQRSASLPAAASVYRVGVLEIDRDAREVRVEGKRADLTSHQFGLLLTLVERRGRVQTRDQLMEATRGTELDSFDRSIDVHISRIRALIEPDPRRPVYIKTVRSEGYVFAPPSREEG